MGQEKKEWKRQIKEPPTRRRRGKKNRKKDKSWKETDRKIVCKFHLDPEGGIDAILHIEKTSFDGFAVVVLVLLQRKARNKLEGGDIFRAFHKRTREEKEKRKEREKRKTANK